MDSIFHPRFHIQYLKNELARRQMRNPRYSMRAFAQAVNIHPSAMSRILAGKLELSLSGCIDLLGHLQITNEDKRLFLASVAEEKNQRSLRVLEKELDEVSAGAPRNASPGPRNSNPATPATVDFSKLIEYSPILTFIADLSGRILYQTRETFPGMKIATDIRGLLPSEIFPADWARKIEDQFERVRQTKRPDTIEVFGPGENPDYFTRLNVPVLNEAGEIEAFLVHVQKTTPEKRLQRNRDLMHEFTSSLARSSTPDEIAETIVSLANKACTPNQPASVCRTKGTKNCRSWSARMKRFPLGCPRKFPSMKRFSTRKSF